MQYGNGWDVTFPLAYKTERTVVATGKAGWGYTCNISQNTLTGVKFNQWQSASGTNNTTAIYWIAIGY